MRTKTTILSAVALAAGLLSASAQVYSANVVGYYNMVVPQAGFKFAANQLIGANNDNSINTQFSSGFISDVNGVNNSVLYYWNGSAFATYQYYTAADSGSVAGWFDGAGTLAVVSVKQGSGCFLYNPANRTTNTIVGQVVQGSITNTIPAGFNVYSIGVPVGTNSDSAAFGYPGTSPGDGNGNTYDTLYQFFGGTFRTATWEQGLDTGGGPNGWYDGAGAATATQPTWNMSVGDAFFVFHANPAVTTWIRSFSVQ